MSASRNPVKNLPVETDIYMSQQGYSAWLWIASVEIKYKAQTPKLVHYVMTGVSVLLNFQWKLKYLTVQVFHWQSELNHLWERLKRPVVILCIPLAILIQDCSSHYIFYVCLGLL